MQVRAYPIGPPKVGVTVDDAGLRHANACIIDEHIGNLRQQVEKLLHGCFVGHVSRDGKNSASGGDFLNG